MTRVQVGSDRMPLWPHAPVHWLFEPGRFIATAATLRQEHHFHSAERRDLLQDRLFALADEFHWQLDAWAVLSNHYHFVARSPDDATTLKAFLGKLHGTIANDLNQAGPVTRTESVVSILGSAHHVRTFLSRAPALRASQPGEARRGANSMEYRWCSAAWFAEHASPAFRATVESFKTDRVNVPDDF